MTDAASRDVQEIIGAEPADAVNSKKSKKGHEKKVKRPKGLHREVWNLMKQDGDDELPPLMPTDTYHSYKKMRMKAGLGRVAPWVWAPFSNPARTDGASFYHWVKVAEKDTEYPFAKLNRSVTVPQITEKDYQLYLTDLPTTASGPAWDFAESQHLFELCSRFDLRFPVIQDRWDRERFPYRSIEDLKERYYSILNTMKVAQTSATADTPKLIVFDADHERRRKEQLIKLLAKTANEVEEEENLLLELKKIELRKKDRERKAQELQRFMTGGVGDKNQQGPQKRGRKRTDLLKASFAAGQLGALQSGLADAAAEPTLEIDLQASLVKFPEFKTAGAYLRSSKLKLPNTIAHRKILALERMMEQYGIDFRVPIATEQLVTEYNNLRRDFLLINDLRETLTSCDSEIRTIVQNYNSEYPTMPLPFEISLQDSIPQAELPIQAPPSPKSSVSSIHTYQANDSDAGSTHSTGIPKRKAALQQTDFLKKIKQT